MSSKTKQTINQTFEQNFSAQYISRNTKIRTLVLFTLAKLTRYASCTLLRNVFLHFEQLPALSNLILGEYDGGGFPILPPGPGRVTVVSAKSFYAFRPLFWRILLIRVRK